MERKMNVADFAALVGATSKTIYQKISASDNLPVNERLITVKEKVKGREISLIVTNDEQINFYKNLYRKDTVINGNYYETLTDNNGNEQVIDGEILETSLENPVTTMPNSKVNFELLEQFITVNNDFNDRYEQKITELLTVKDELIEVKSRQLLLEDKASREGMYIGEINELKKDNNRYKLYVKGLLTVITLLIIAIVGYSMFMIGQIKTVDSEPAQIETKKEAPQPEPATAPQRITVNSEVKKMR